MINTANAQGLNGAVIHSSLLFNCKLSTEEIQLVAMLMAHDELFKEIVQQIQAAEREACAVVVEYWDADFGDGQWYWNQLVDAIAAAIRARGESDGQQKD